MKLEAAAPYFFKSFHTGFLVNQMSSYSTSSLYSFFAAANTNINSTGALTTPSHSEGAHSHCACSHCTGSVPKSLLGLPDSALAFTTVGTKGQRYRNDNRDLSTDNLRKWTRSNGKSDGRGATAVTFAFTNDFKVDGISTERAKALLKTAMQTWANYAPLDFVEIGDPGNGRLVDILVQSSAIDGPSGTLAYAYFPGNGDITFDNGELWTESTFLEAAVHEIGHSLGLDHEDGKDENGNDIPAIMNSVLGERFSQGAYLYRDDAAGIQSIYGIGQGSVTSLDNQPTADLALILPAAPVVNLVTNGSFEDSPVRDGTYGGYRQIKGWTLISGRGFQIDKRPATFGKAADGNAWVELDAYGQNATIGQNIDTVTGQTYDLSVSFTNGGRASSTTKVDVFWDGKNVGRLTGGSKGQWKDFNYEVQGGTRSVSTLAFRAVGTSDSVGGFIDNIVVTEARQALAPLAGTTVLGSSQPTMNRDPISGESKNLVATGSYEGDFTSGLTYDRFGFV